MSAPPIPVWMAAILAVTSPVQGDPEQLARAKFFEQRRLQREQPANRHQRRALAARKKGKR